MAGFGNILGVRASIQLGRGPVLAPAPYGMMEAIDEIEVRLSAIGPSGIKVSLLAGRDGPLGLMGPPFVDNPLYQRDSRIAVTVWNGVKPSPVFDGLITKTQYLPGEGANEGRYIMLGRDLQRVMDLEERHEQYPNQDETAIVQAVAARYSLYGMTSLPVPPTVIDPPIQVDRVPQQTTTDLAFLRQLAARHGYKVLLEPGPMPGKSTLYVGPIPIPGPPQKAISVNLGPMSDAFGVTVEHDGETLTAARAKVQDRATGQVTELPFPGTTTIPQEALPEAIARLGSLPERRMQTSGLNAAQVLGRLMGLVNQSGENALRVKGTIDNLRYNGVLKPFRQVQIRGLGLAYNGLYTVAETRHLLKPGSYTQRFTLQRGGLYPQVPAVTPEVVPA